VHLSNTQLLIVFGIYAVIGGGVWIHADRNGSKHPTAWAMCVVLFLAVALPVYLIHVHRSRHAR
jgi:hypothetical protein